MWGLWKVSSRPPSEEEVNRHRLILVIKFLHEAEHEATGQFLRLPRVVAAARKTRSHKKRKERDASLDGDSAAIGEGEPGIGVVGAVASGLSPAIQTRSKTLDIDKLAAVRPPSSQADALQINPESSGNTLENGKSRVDSGYALEQRILGGRLKHCYLEKKDTFQVRTNHSHSFYDIC